MVYKALYNWRVNRGKGKNVIVDVQTLEEHYSEITYRGFRKWVSTSRLKPYYDPDADGTQFLFLGYMICTQVCPSLVKFGIYNPQDEFIGTASTLPEAKQMIINKLLKKE